MTKSEAFEIATSYVEQEDPRLMVRGDGAFEYPDGWAFLCRTKSGEDLIGGILAVVVDKRDRSARGLGAGTGWHIMTKWGATRLVLCTGGAALSASLIGSVMQQGVQLEEIVTARAWWLREDVEVLVVRPENEATSLCERLVKAGLPVFTRSMQEVAGPGVNNIGSQRALAEVARPGLARRGLLLILDVLAKVASVFR
jgi:hypothetical protein